MQVLLNLDKNSVYFKEIQLDIFHNISISSS